ncbi:hypothetical protein BC833DRAFT_626143 [Globomyces pollinis-pini]|nr:hypothetical protein BC833DRAFT_626143 [Globomyces pollinis-pini]KAJ2992646.1 hypothetical protein HDV02_002956 [Globomyces sp. JEL0801]
MSKSPTVLITGASGNIGTALIEILDGAGFNIIAGHHPSAPIPSSLISKCSSIELDYDSVTTVTNAFDTDIDYLFLIPSKSEERALQAKRLVAVAVEKNIKFIVLVSLLDCNSRSGMLAAQFRYIEQYIEATGIPYTFLRCAPLQQNFLDLKEHFHQSLATISIPIGTGGYAPIHCKDVAKVAKTILDHPKQHSSRTYRLTGPELLTGVLIAGKAAQGLDRPVRFINRSVVTSKSPTWASFLDQELYALIAKGFFTSVSKDVEILTGIKGITLQDFFKENRELFNSYPSAARL